jgi:Short C-terminal domain
LSKAGVWAGTTFGARVATIYYADVTGIEVNTGLVNCVVEVSTASYPALGKKSVWFGGRTSRTDVFNRDPFTESNTIPVLRFDLKKWQPYLERLRALIAESKRQARSANLNPAQPGFLAPQLTELAELHRSGALDDAEFAQAKARILASE